MLINDPKYYKVQVSYLSQLWTQSELVFVYIFQMREFRNLLDPDGMALVNNFRPVQNLGDRRVQYTDGSMTIGSNTIPDSIKTPPPSSGGNKNMWSYKENTGNV